ncbi:hypothetical protein AGR1B_Lc70027 [Agrobacterium fabacearum S56]|nr:hypothetical protein AGR1B_Lc70027 [Agrobacterium fabacearum S56]
MVPGAPPRGELLVIIASGWVANPPNLFAATMFREDNNTAGQLFSKQFRVAPVRRERKFNLREHDDDGQIRQIRSHLQNGL